MGVVNFAGRLRELRQRAGLTQAELAEKASLSKAGVADLEQGRREPSWATVIALAAALGATCVDFLEVPAPREKATRGRPPKASQEVAPVASGMEQPEPNVASEKPRKRTGRGSKERD